MSAPVLILSNFKEPFVLETNALGVGILLFYVKVDILLLTFLRSCHCECKGNQHTLVSSMPSRSLAKFRHYLLGHKFE